MADTVSEVKGYRRAAPTQRFMGGGIFCIICCFAPPHISLVLFLEGFGDVSVGSSPSGTQSVIALSPWEQDNILIYLQ